MTCGHFRHSFDAHNDYKLQEVIDTMGFEGYGLYFALLEICAKEYYKTGDTSVKIHIQSIRKVWRKQTQSCKKVLTKFQESGLFVVTFSEHLVICHIANLSKYVGFYPPKKKEKEKEKETKEKKSKENYINTLPPGGEEKEIQAETKQATLAVGPEIKGPCVRTPEQKMQSHQIREVYRQKYRERWGINPTFGAAENAMIYKLIERVGISEALKLAALYPSYPDPWHVGQKHAFKYLLGQLDKIRVEIYDPRRMLDGIQNQKHLQEAAERATKEARRQDRMDKIQQERREIAMQEISND